MDPAFRVVIHCEVIAKLGIIIIRFESTAFGQHLQHFIGNKQKSESESSPNIVESPGLKCLDAFTRRTASTGEVKNLVDTAIIEQFRRRK